MKSVADIVKDWLVSHGYDGLCGDECGCFCDDLFPCGEIPCDCVAGYRDGDLVQARRGVVEQPALEPVQECENCLHFDAPVPGVCYGCFPGRKRWEPAIQEPARGHDDEDEQGAGE